MRNDKSEKTIILILIVMLVLSGTVFAWSIKPFVADKPEVSQYSEENREKLQAENNSVDEGRGTLPWTEASRQTESQTSEPGLAEEGLSEADMPKENLPKPASSQEESILQPEMTNGQSQEYILVQEEEIRIPEAVAGRGGYQPVENNSQQVGEADSRRLQSELNEGETGDGLDFSEEFYPYYHMLKEEEKRLYRQIYANAAALNPAFRPVEAVSVEKLKNVFSAVSNDHPELFWLDTAYSCKYDMSGMCVEMELTFNQTADSLETAKEAFDRKTEEILAQLQGSSYEKEKQIHQLLLDRTDYNLSAGINQSAYSALVDGQSVCAGYAKAFQYLMQRTGIPCYYCVGFAGENHAWNIVKLEGDYYNVDVTWDDVPGGEYSFFNKSDQDFASTHSRQELSVYLPPCNGEQYRNLEKSAGKPGLRTLEEAGLADRTVCHDMQEYFAECSSQIMQTGKGDYSFLSVLEGRMLLQEWQQSYDSGSYKQAYLEQAMRAVGASSCQMELKAEELQGDRYLITHQVRIQ